MVLLEPPAALRTAYRRAAGGFRDCQAAAFSPGGKRLAAVVVATDYTWELRLWDPATGELRRTLLKIPTGQVWKSNPAPMVQSRHVRIAFRSGRPARGVEPWVALEDGRPDPADESAHGPTGHGGP